MDEARLREQRMRWILAILFWVALAFAILPSGLTFSHEISDDGQSGSLFRRVQWMSPFMVAALVAWLRRDLAIALIRRIDPCLLGFVLWATASTAWSGYPDITLRKIVLLVGAVLLALSFQLTTFEPGRLRRHLRWAFTLTVLISLVVSVALPHVGQVAAYDNAWAGITRSKNHLGLLSGWTAVLWLHALAIGEANTRRALAWTAISLLVLLMADDATALLCTLVALPAMWFALRPPFDGRRVAVAGVLGAAILAITVVFIMLVVHGVPSWQEIVAPVAHSVGRNATFTGRLEIWQLVYAEAIQHPWLGSGFQAFWLGIGGPAPWVTQNLYGVLWQGHDGYLDVFNETGLIGLGLALAFLCNTIRRALRLPAAFDAERVLLIVFVVFFAAANLTESIIFRPMHFVFLLSIYDSLSISRLQIGDTLEHPASEPAPALEVSP
ncbi:O-antigen ligase family protein [Salinisphaera sp. SPP-AMP-43]|uniref:O-antigen ligase family protein n=1 Tax=Salinisphaera sp. SPP-AMP-43 TaxID=3121288 RepID=UPI003C6DE4EF